VVAVGKRHIHGASGGVLDAAGDLATGEHLETSSHYLRDDVRLAGIVTRDAASAGARAGAWKHRLDRDPVECAGDRQDAFACEFHLMIAHRGCASRDMRDPTAI
jgi:hypothetical protein